MTDAKTILELASKIRRRAEGFRARGSAIFNGSIIADELVIIACDLERLTAATGAAMSEHTPPPWFVRGVMIPGVIVDESGNQLAAAFSDVTGGTAERNANAAFIVEAVNNYESLRAQLTSARKALADILDAANDPYEIAIAALRQEPKP